MTTETIFGFSLLTLVLSAGCASTPSALRRPVPEKDYYNFTGQPTETWRVEVTAPPAYTDLDVFYHPKGAPYGIAMQPVAGHPNLFQAAAPRGVAVSFTVKFADGTSKQCGGAKIPNRFEYCGQIRVWSNAPNMLNPQGKVDHFEEQRYRITATMVRPEGERSSWNCKTASEEVHETILIPGGLHNCRYLSFFYE